MQPVPEPPCPSASMGAEWMGSESEALDVTAKRVAKESIVVWVWMRCEDRKMVRQVSEDQRLAQALLLYGERSDFHKLVLCPRSFVCLPLSHQESLVSSIVFLASAFLEPARSVIHSGVVHLLRHPLAYSKCETLDRRAYCKVKVVPRLSFRVVPIAYCSLHCGNWPHSEDQLEQPLRFSL